MKTPVESLMRRDIARNLSLLFNAERALLADLAARSNFFVTNSVPPEAVSLNGVRVG